MPQLSASLESAERMATLPETKNGVAPYPVRVKAEKTEFSKKTGAPMICLQFDIDDGEYRGRELPGMSGWYYIMAGGKRENGMNHDLSRLFETINALKAEWTCEDCGHTSQDNFAKEKVKGSFHFMCPACGKRANVKLDGTWQGLQARCRVGVEKMQGSDGERNTIDGLLPRD
jgi:predicted RNA-binding Zn-ribbon protein involved in translation (DUF1610 family)